ncbi:MAG: hypothetical protein EZS28_043213 [Streblomastix strix]|uniref:Uncharacterized protein n=1 Tax=Streblomastix strix TaxID=222440 RepID=A0A5J4TTC8_9EUKA|nr:MAG: hypothetical protein EZS28_043213 [Streblomastix strix]
MRQSTTKLNLNSSAEFVNRLCFKIDELALQLCEDKNSAVIFYSDLITGFKQTPECMANATLVLGIAANGFSIPSKNI